MSEETKELNLYQRINEIRKKVDYVQKNKTVDTGRGTYKAVTHDEVTGIIRQHLVDFGVVIVPSLVKSSIGILPPDKDGNPAKMIRYEATYDFKFVNTDKPNESLVIQMEAHAMDNQDKAPGKALSYAKKYAVLKLFEIETGEDEESRHAEKGEFPLETHLLAMETAINDADLQASYLVAKKSAMEWPDPAAFRVLAKKAADLLELLRKPK